MSSRDLQVGEIVLLEGVAKAYRVGEHVVWALKKIDLEVERGEFFAVVGPSGSGKSTLLYIVGGLARPTEGRVVVDGVDLSTLRDDELSEFRHEKIGFVFQMYYLIPRMTALKNVMLPLRLRGISGREAERRALEALELVGMEHRARHRPTQLSAGEQQRVAIARALVTEPVLLLADEPTGNLDYKSTVQIMELFERLNRELRVTIIMVTHNLSLVEYCSRAARLVDGTIAGIYERGEYTKLIEDMAKGARG